MRTGLTRNPLRNSFDYGECHMAGGGTAELAWPNYANELGLTPEHVSELIRLGVRSNTPHTPIEQEPAVWAPTHAWRALGQLRALEAVVPVT